MTQHDTRRDQSSSPLPEQFLESFQAMPAGSSRGTFDRTTWIATRRSSADGRRHWLYAEEAGGDGVVSANLYCASSGRLLLKPCEMSREAVVAFVLGYRPFRT